MSKISDKKKLKRSNRKQKVVDMSTYAGKVKAFKKVEGLSYQKKIRSDD